MTTHTPTPWFVHNDTAIATEFDNGGRVADAAKGISVDGDYCMTETSKANAEFIVKACNHHNDLVQLAESVLFAARIEVEQGNTAWQQFVDVSTNILEKVKAD